MQLTKLILQTNSPQSLYEFYNRLQLQVDKIDGDSFEIKTGESIIQFFPAAENANPTYHFAFNIPSNKIAEAHDWLKERVELLWIGEYNSEIADFANWHAKSVYFIDPAGNVVELIARFDLQDNEANTFSPAQIRSVSEIGLVLDVDMFDEVVTSFMQKYSLSYFEKQPPLPGSRAIGNDDGLFIVVPENRVWYPSKNQVSLRAPLVVEWSEGGNSFKYNR